MSSGRLLRPGQSSIAKLRAELDQDIRRLEAESSEIDMLMAQVVAEIERHAARRAKVEAQRTSVESGPAPSQDQLTEIRDSLLAVTRRELLFDAQRQVLEGKQRALTRFLERLVEIDSSLEAITKQANAPAPGPFAAWRPAGAPTPSGAMPAPPPQRPSQPASQIRSQEELRREIVRQLHDGPAQSIANIGLQAEIVERLVRTHDDRANTELEALRHLVQQSLEATKEFIFEVRPMVLDDLGLGPTIRRAAADRSRRTGIDVDFDVQGTEERIAADLESAIFRSVDEAIAGYLSLHPSSVIVRLDWTERELVATVEGSWAAAETDAAAGSSSTAASRPGETPPVLLAMMEEKRSQDLDAQTAARALGADRVAEIGNRARALGMTLNMRDQGRVMELVTPIIRANR